MSKHIKLDDAIERMNELYHGYEVEEWLKSLPTIEVSEGEWVKVDDSVQPICPKCGMSCSGIHRNADYSVVPTWNYCPNCGAKMKGAEE